MRTSREQDRRDRGKGEAVRHGRGECRVSRGGAWFPRHSTLAPRVWILMNLGLSSFIADKFCIGSLLSPGILAALAKAVPGRLNEVGVAPGLSDLEGRLS